MSTSKNNCRVEKLKVLATVASISVSVALSLLKAFAAFSTGSLSVLSSLVDSLADILSSSISYIAVQFSNKPLSEKHRYGYGKAESVSALFQSAFIAGSGGFIFYDGISRFIHPVEVEQTSLGLIIMFISLGLTLALILFQKFVVSKTKSMAVSADSAHYTVDLLTNFAIILSLLAVKYLHWEWFDIFTAVLISAYLIYNAFKIALSALSEITDCEVDDNCRSEIIALVNSVSEVKGLHDLRTRISGSRMFIEIHLELDGKLTLLKAHDLTNVVEQKIISVFPNAQIIIHQDPYGIRENRLDHEISGRCSLS